jgi:adenylate cyclase
MIVEFGSVVDAVQCGIDIQRAMSKRNADVPDDRRIDFRVGINLGDIIVDGDDIYGDGVNVAARLEELSEPGEVYISGTAYDHLKRNVDVDYEFLGERSVKNLSQPIRTYRAQMDRAPPTAASGLGATDQPLEKSAIAVLPFENLSGDPAQEFFADGLTEDLITALSQWRTFPVIARNSTFLYKGTSVDVRRAAEELGARYIIEGSVRKSGNRIRVAAQLIEGSTGHHLWAENLDRDLEDIFELQDDLTQRIAATVMPELEQTDVSTRVSIPHQNLDAWGLLHQALARIYEHHPEGFAEAREILEKALEIDPTYARAHAWMAYSYFRDVLVGAARPSEEIWRKATTAARQAIELDDLDGLAHHVLGLVYLRTGQHDLALVEQQRAMELNPSLVSTHVGLGQILAQIGRTEEGIAILDRALQLNPRDPRRWNHLDVTTNAYITAGNFEKAAELARDSMQRRPDNAMSHLYLAVSLGNLDQIAEARSELATAQGIDPNIVPRHESTRPQKFPKDHENFLEGLRKAGWEG